MKRKVMLAVAASVVALMPVMAQAANKLIVKNATGTTDMFVVTDGGYIGSGHNAPLAGLHLKGTGGAEPTQVRTQYYGDVNTGSGGFVAFRNKANNSLPTSGDRLGYILFGALDGTTPRYSAGFFAYADGAWTSLSTPSYYAFETTKAGKNTRDEWMRIASTGYVGVGTPVPNMNLEVNGGVRLNASSTPATVTSPARTAPTKPVCDNTNGPNIRGTLWFTKSAAGVADTLEVCAKGADENYAWKAVIN